MKNKILIVDDDKDILEPLSLILQSKGYDVQAISKGQLVYSEIAKFKPDLLLLDILISGVDGRDICQELKQKNKMQELIILLMSAHPSAEKDSGCIGADGFIAKPFETDDLLAMLKEKMG